MTAAVLVFDLDGTLSAPLEGIGRSINHALRELAA
jgi:phosphoglycolate phosphatase-like HAD superfamily hydrolase